jgi:hypothetical protein
VALLVEESSKSVISNPTYQSIKHRSFLWPRGTEVWKVDEEDLQNRAILVHDSLWNDGWIVPGAIQ